jgi:hypothetical protein
MTEIPMTLKIQKSLPTGIELFNVKDACFYGFNTYYGKVYEGMFVYNPQRVFVMKYEYILRMSDNKLFKLAESLPSV